MSDGDRDDPKDESGGGWVHAALAGVLARVERQQREAEEHARTCTDRPCERCERYVCRCGAVIDGIQECESCRDRAAIDAYLKPTRDSIPPHFRWAMGATEATLLGRVKGSAELVRRALANPPSSGLLLLGDTGTGKTSLVVAMLDAWVRAAPRERKGAMFVESGWLSRARARYRLGADEAPLVASCMAAPLLVLDDLGSEREDRDGCIADVLWSRTNQDRPLWVTSGLASGDQAPQAFMDALARRYDGGFARRILETSKRVTLGAK